MYKIGREIIAIRKILHKKGQKIKDSGHAIKFNFSLVRTLWSVALATPSAQPSPILSGGHLCLRPSDFVCSRYSYKVTPMALTMYRCWGWGRMPSDAGPFYKRTLTVPASFKVFHMIAHSYADRLQKQKFHFQ